MTLNEHEQAVSEIEAEVISGANPQFRGDDGRLYLATIAQTEAAQLRGALWTTRSLRTEAAALAARLDAVATRLIWGY